MRFSISVDYEGLHRTVDDIANQSNPTPQQQAVRVFPAAVFQSSAVVGFK